MFLFDGTNILSLFYFIVEETNKQETHLINFDQIKINLCPKVADPSIVIEWELNLVDLYRI